MCKIQDVRTINPVFAHADVSFYVLPLTAGRQTEPFFQSNFGENEMGDELQREGWRMSSALNYKIQKQIALLSICLTHSCAHTLVQSAVTQRYFITLPFRVAAIKTDIRSVSASATQDRKKERLKDGSAIFSACVQPASQFWATALTQLFFL